MSESIIQASGQELDAIAKDDLGTDAPQTSFSKASKKMIATNDGAYQSMRTMVRNRMYKEKDYNPEQIANIIASGNLTEQQDLSRAYFYKDGYYKQILCYYANLLTYAHLLIPNPGHGKTLSTPHIEKRYYQAMDFVDRNAFNTLMQGWMLKALTDGCYYGVKTEADKNSFVVLDLPAKYCISRFKDVYGNDIIEFDLSYFNSITNAELKESVLAKEKEISELNDKYLRLYAEYDNFRRRSAKERENTYFDAKSDTLKNILPILDNMERATAFTEADKVLEGMNLILKSFNENFAKMDVKEIEALGKTFDPNVHYAVMHIEDESYGENEVVEVLQKGYICGDKVIRYAMVKVAN